MESHRPEFKFIHASLVGTNLGIRAATRGKAMGVRRGFPDIFAPIKRGESSGLCIEMKSEKGVLSKEQKEWHIFLTKNGFEYYVCRSAREVLRIIFAYFGIATL